MSEIRERIALLAGRLCTFGGCYAPGGCYAQCDECKGALEAADFILAIPKLDVLLKLAELAESKDSYELVVVDRAAELPQYPHKPVGNAEYHWLHKWGWNAALRAVKDVKGFVKEVTASERELVEWGTDECKGALEAADFILATPKLAALLKLAELAESKDSYELVVVDRAAELPEIPTNLGDVLGDESQPSFYGAYRQGQESVSSAGFVKAVTV